MISCLIREQRGAMKSRVAAGCQEFMSGRKLGASCSGLPKVQLLPCFPLEGNGHLCPTSDTPPLCYGESKYV